MQNRIMGALYGQAVGDALGLPAEFKSSAAIEQKWPDEDWPSDYEATVRTHAKWLPGEWSDDTEQALVLLDTYLQGVARGRLAESDPDTLQVAAGLQRWAASNGRGMGNHTANVLAHPLFLSEPFTAAFGVWTASGGVQAPNGAVMRTSYVGVLRPFDLDWTARVASNMARITHYDPRCVASAVAVSVAVAAMIQGIPEGEILDTVCRYAAIIEPGCEPYVRSATLEDLNLDEGLPGKGAPIGYTYKCLGAGFWALRECWRREADVPVFARHPTVDQVIFGDVLRAVIRAGGDTDTNGAVAGALMGAQLGFEGIPNHLTATLRNRVMLDDRYNHLTRLSSGRAVETASDPCHV